MSLSRNIRFLRKKQGWGQDVLADKLGYKSYTTIQKWESGVSEPPLRVVHALAALFNVEINALTQCDLETGGTSNRNTLDEADIRFYNDYKELQEEDKETLRDMAHLMRERKAKKTPSQD